MKVVLNAGHGLQTMGKGFDGLKEYEFNRAVCGYARAILENEYEGVEVMYTHSDKLDVPLHVRTDKANKWGADVWIGVHANAYDNNYNGASGIETYVYSTKFTESLELAKLVQKNLVELTKRIDRGVKTADLHEVRETKMSAILVECGFMTNPEENKLLKTEAYRLSCATAIVDGLAEKYKLKHKDKATGALHRVIVQHGAYASKANAIKHAEQLRKQGLYAQVVTDKK